MFYNISLVFSSNAHFDCCNIIQNYVNHCSALAILFVSLSHLLSLLMQVQKSTPRRWIDHKSPQIRLLIQIKTHQ